jgi:dihydroflavonol-4-reductase
MQIAITGASGHVGVNLTRHLCSMGHSVRVLIHNNEKGLEGLPLEKVYGKMTDPLSVHALVEGCEVVFHLAAVISITGKTSNHLPDPNIEGTRVMLDTLRGRKGTRLVHFSSIHALVQEPYDAPLNESRPLAVNDPIWYSRSKAFCEHFVQDAVRDGLDAVVLNPTSIIGPSDYTPSLMGTFVLDLCKGQIPFLIPGGYDFVDVRDVAEAAWNAVQNGKCGERYLLSGSWIALPEFSQQLMHCLKEWKKPPMVPFWTAYAGLPFIQAYAFLLRKRQLYTPESLKIIRTSHKYIQSDKARKELGFTPRPFTQTMADLIQWLGEHEYLP